MTGSKLNTSVIKLATFYHVKSCSVYTVHSRIVIISTIGLKLSCTGHCCTRRSHIPIPSILCISLDVVRIASSWLLLLQLPGAVFGYIAHRLRQTYQTRLNVIDQRMQRPVQVHQWRWSAPVLSPPSPSRCRPCRCGGACPAWWRPGRVRWRRLCRPSALAVEYG